MDEVDSVPEFAIQAFEQVHGVLVTVHDLVGSITNVISPERIAHRHALCRAVKHRGQRSICQRFDGRDVAKALSQLPEGRVHVCHAGLVECAAPALIDGELEWILFAGPRRAASDLIPDAIEPDKSRGWPSNLPLPPQLDHATSRLLLESLRQLISRLVLWRQEHAPRQAATPPQGATQRSAMIRAFINRNHGQGIGLDAIASRLRLSPGRASRVIRSACGMGFSEMLTAARMQTAQALLRHTDLPVMTIALNSGFNDLANFHRMFRRHYGTTPAAWRLAERGKKRNSTAADDDGAA